MSAGRTGLSCSVNSRVRPYKDELTLRVELARIEEERRNTERLARNIAHRKNSPM